MKQLGKTVYESVDEIAQDDGITLGVWCGDEVRAVGCDGSIFSFKIRVTVKGKASVFIEIKNKKAYVAEHRVM
jgi:hypothetical protein